MPHTQATDPATFAIRWTVGVHDHDDPAVIIAGRDGRACAIDRADLATLAAGLADYDRSPPTAIRSARQAWEARDLGRAPLRTVDSPADEAPPPVEHPPG